MSVDEVCGYARVDQALAAEPVDREMVTAGLLVRTPRPDLFKVSFIEHVSEAAERPPASKGDRQLAWQTCRSAGQRDRP